ncbi:Uncharacterised protein [Escherichia coli]|uniref:hypothetical protein n=1 Tax=Escherichia coli TaxID=562 RepID=UPI000DA58FED|nr:hypothetical protein [Escherichia coli]SQS28721.1 Uncharacterised protein [Escherichia coli]
MSSLNVHISNLIKVDGLNYSVEKSENGLRAECIDKGFKAFFVKLWQDWFGESKALHQALEQWVQDDSDYVCCINTQYDSFMTQYTNDEHDLSIRGMNFKDPCFIELISNVSETLNVLLDNPPQKITDQSVRNFQEAIDNIKYYMQLFNSFALNYRVRDTEMNTVKMRLGKTQHELLKNYVAEPLSDDSKQYSPEVKQHIQNEVNEIYLNRIVPNVGGDLCVAIDINRQESYWTTCDFKSIAANTYPEIAGLSNSKSGRALSLISKIPDLHYNTVLADVRESVSNLRNAVYNPLFGEADIMQAIIEYDKHMDDMIVRMELMCKMDAEIKNESDTLAKTANENMLKSDDGVVYNEYQHFQQRIQSLSDSLSNNLRDVNCSSSELQEALNTYQSEMNKVLSVLMMWTSCVSEIHLSSEDSEDSEDSQAAALLKKLKFLASQFESPLEEDTPLLETMQLQVDIARDTLKNFIDTSNDIPSNQEVSAAISSYNNALQQIDLKASCCCLIHGLINLGENLFRKEVCTSHVSINDVHDISVKLCDVPISLDAAYDFGYSRHDAKSIKSCLDSKILEQTVKLGFYQSLLIEAKDKILNTSDVALLEEFKKELEDKITPQQVALQNKISAAVSELRNKCSSYFKKLEGSLPEVKFLTLYSPQIQRSVNSIENIKAMLQEIIELGKVTLPSNSGHAAK